MPANCSSTCSCVYPAMAKALYITSGKWLRIAPEDSSTPLQTMSYWKARMSSGSLVSSASRPPCGIEKEIGRAHVCTPVTNAHIVCRLLLEKKNSHFTTINMIFYYEVDNLLSTLRASEIKLTVPILLV